VTTLQTERRTGETTRTPIIEINNVVKTYDTGSQQVRALKGVNLSVERGEMVAIMGPSGCGKTTLLNCASGLDVVDAGTICIAGSDLAELTDKTRTAFRAQNMGFVFQTYNLLARTTALANVELPLVYAGSSQRRELARRALERVGLAQRAMHHPSELSGGEQQRVAIARALINRPALVLADEPTGNLDTRTGEEIMKLFLDLHREEGVTLVLVTHEPDIGRQAQRILFIRDGRLQEERREV